MLLILDLSALEQPGFIRVCQPSKIAVFLTLFIVDRFGFSLKCRTTLLDKSLVFFVWHLNFSRVLSLVDAKALQLLTR